MSERNIWEDLYGLGLTTTSISTAASVDVGYPLTGHPDLNSGQNIIDQRKAIGVSYRRGDNGYEFQQGTQNPSTTWELDVSKSSLSRMLWLLFQKGGFQGAGSGYPKYFVPYDDMNCEVWASLVRKLAPSGTATSHRIVGSIVKSITLSSNEGETLKASVEFTGRSFEDNRDVASDSFSIAAHSPLLWQNATVTLGGNTINIDGFSITITNNAVSKTRDNTYPLAHNLGEFTVEGTISIPYGTTTEGGNTAIDDFVAGNTDRLVIRWGSNEIAAVDGDFSIISHIRRTNATLTGDNEILTEIPFVGVSNLEKNSNNTSTSSTLAIAGSTSATGTNTEFNSMSVGDLLYTQASAAGDRTVRVIRSITSDTAIGTYPAFSGTESGLLYKAKATPLTISLYDTTQITSM